MAVKIERRHFLKTLSLTSVGLLPGVNLLAGLTTPENALTPPPDTTFIDYACRLLHHESLLYLEFYFLNVRLTDSGKALLPVRWDDKYPGQVSNHKIDAEDGKKPRAYMVVRLPQQHIAEEFFDQDNLLEKKGQRVYAQTAISGYSFLVFEFQQKLSLNPQTLLNWNASYFNLIVKESPGQALFDIKSDKGYVPLGYPYVNEYPLGYRKGKFDRNRFPKYDHGRYGRQETFSKEKANYAVTDKYLLSDPGPATAIEAPYRLILSPKLPDTYAYQFYWTFGFPAKKKSCSPDGKEGYCTTAELWTATLRVRKRKNIRSAQISKDPKAETDGKQQNEGDNQMELMIIGSPEGSVQNFGGEHCTFKKLPCGQDREDLVYLYIHARLTARTPGLTFSPLGISTYINFRNSSYDKNHNSLYQWNQQISYGRDQQVTVSRIMVDSLHGCKMLHIRCTNRETYNGQSVLVYREFLMPLDVEKDFSLYENGSHVNAYIEPNWKYRSCLKRSRFHDPHPIEIKPIDKLSPDRVVLGNQTPEEARTGCDCSNTIEGRKIVAFRPVTLDGRELQWEMRMDDWHDEDVPEEPVDTPPTEPAVKKGKRYDVNLFMLSSDLAKDPSYEMLYETNRGKMSFGEVYKNVFSGFDVNTKFADEKKRIDKNIDDLKKEAANRIGNRVWIEILEKTEDFQLQKTDLYREYLEKKIGQIEEKLRSRAAVLADEVMEEWNAFKRRALHAEGDILSIVERLRIEIERILSYLPAAEAVIRVQFERLQAAVGLIGQDIRRDIERDFGQAVTRIQEYRARLEEVLRDFFTRAALPDFEEAFARLFSSFRDRIAVFEHYHSLLKKIENMADSLGIEYAYRLLLSRWPPRFAENIRAELQAEIEQIRDCIHHLHHVEETLLGKAQVFKAKVGYAVSHVEDELAELKKKLEEKIPNKEQWQKAYEALRRKYHEEVNKPISALQTEYIIFRNNFKHFAKDFKDQAGSVSKEIRQVFDFYHENACFPQLHTAKVYVDTVTDLVEREIPLRIKYAEEYFKNQTRNLILDTQNNAAKVFAEIKADSKELIKGAVREIGKEMGGLINPELAADFLSYAKDVRTVAAEAKQRTEEIKNILDSAKGQLDTAITNKIDELKNAGDGLASQARDFINKELNVPEIKETLRQAKNSLVLLSKEAKQALLTKENEAKAYFQQLEAKILGSIHLKDIIGDKAMLPRLDRKGDKITYTFITNKLISPPRNPVFSFLPNANTNLVLHLEKPLKNPRDYLAWTRLNDFAVGIFDERVIIRFQQLQVYSDNRTKNKVSVQIKDVNFQKELAFIEALAKNIKLPGTGLSLSIRPTDISVDFAYQLPGISGGAFNFFNVKFHVGFTIPFPIGGGVSKPIYAKFGINAPDDKFVLGVGIWGGRGHAVVEATPKYIQKVDVGIDYGGLLALNLGIAQGQAFLMAGVRYVYSRSTLDGSASMELYAIVTCGGSVTVFGFITISVVFLLGLKYEKRPGVTSLYGIASLTYSVEIGFFKKSFTLSFSKRLYGSDNSAASREDYGYRLQYRRNAYGENGVTQALWREEGESDRMFRFAGDKEKTQPIEDEYTYGQLPLEKRYTPKEWRRICNMQKFEFE